MYKALLFDLDDTLLDFKAAEDYAFKELMQESKIPYTQQLFVQYDAINRKLWHQLEQQEITKQYLLDQRFTRFFAELGYDNLDGIAAERRFRQLLGEGAFLMPNAKETLIILKNAGYQLYTASNGVYQTQIRRMQATGIIEFFDGHFISETVGFEKPNVKFFDYILDQLHLSKRDVLMIGDGLNSDIKGALASDIDCVFYDYAQKNQPNAAQYMVTNLLDLPTVF